MSPSQSQKVDFASATDAQRATMIDHATEVELPSASATQRPNIVISTDEHVVNDEAARALATLPNVYQRGGMLVQIVRSVSDDPDDEGISRGRGTPYIALLSRPLVRERLSAAARFCTLDKNGERTPAHPPGWCASALHARREWEGVRVLRGIIEAPTLRRNGSVLEVPGYDARTGLVYVPNGVYPPVPASPTRDDARASAEALLAIVRDFPFENPADRSAWLALVLSLVAHYAVSPPRPMPIANANTPGTGKGLLMHAANIIAAGRPMSIMIQAESDAEDRKRITSIAIAGDRAVLIDNVDRPIGGAPLEAALTCPGDWEDRPLGTNDTVRLPLNTTFAATANNIDLRGDMPRRVYPINLRSTLEAPEERTDLEHPDLLAWLQRARPKLLVDALTIMRAHVVAGSPVQESPPWGSYDAWCRKFRDPLIWLGLPDPLANRKEFRSVSDRRRTVLRGLVTALAAALPDIGDPLLEGGHGVTAARLCAALKDDETAAAKEGRRVRWQALRDVIGEMCGAKLDASTIGYKLRKFRNVPVGGRQIEAVKGHDVQWTVVDVVSASAPDAPSRDHQEPSSDDGDVSFAD